MKKLFQIISTIVFILSICLSCGNKSKTSDDNSAKFDTIIHEYPSTAIVIRDAVTDIDGNHYDAVQIGDQVWMAENLRTTRYADGTEIPMENIWSCNSPYRYLLYKINEEDTKKEKKWKKELNDKYLHIYGYLYNWEAVMHGSCGSNKNPSGVTGICPTGWHVPSDEEWYELEKTLDLDGNFWRGCYAGKISGNLEWSESNKAGTPGNYSDPNHNTSGFSALPGGASIPNYEKHCERGNWANFWTATNSNDQYDFLAISVHLRFNEYVTERESQPKQWGLSVRCIQNKKTEENNIIKNAVTDIDGNSYDAVQIGNQVWMKNNLRTTRYADGTDIPLGSTYSYTEPYRYIPGSNQNNEQIVNQYGFLYNWAAVLHGSKPSWENPSNVQGICPKGWHVPSNAEWEELESTLTTANVGEHCDFRGDHAGKMAGGEAGTWEESHTAGAPGNYGNPDRNISGLSILPAGYSSSENNNSFGKEAWFWSSSEDYGDNAYDRRLTYNHAGVVKANRRGTYCGYSVRCVRD